MICIIPAGEHTEQMVDRRESLVRSILYQGCVAITTWQPNNYGKQTAFFKQLDKAYTKLPEYDMKLVLCNFNA
uniref:Uncharacterized protein n=1 Tax=Megaselia scalaris TaxID=36166 RepID=T1GXH3_MEGSC